VKLKTCLILFIVLCAVSLAAYFFGVRENENRPSQAQGKALFGHLDVNKIAEIEITAPDSGVAISRGELFWTVKNRWGYPADFDKVATFVKKVAGLKSGREFPASDDALSRLNLKTPGTEAENGSKTGAGVRVVFKNEKGSVIADATLGKSRSVSSGGGGSYVRIQNPPMIHLVDKVFSFIETEPSQWIDKKILEIPPEDIEQIDVWAIKKGKTKKQLTLKRPSRGEAPVLAGGSDGKKSKMAKEMDPSAIDDMFGALSSVQAEDVMEPLNVKSAAPLFLKAPLFYDYRLYNGTVFRIKAGGPDSADEERYYFKAKATFPKLEETAGPDASGDAATEGAVAEKNRRKSITDRLSWTHVISKWTFESLMTP
jgi:hypothetical protein